MHAAAKAGQRCCCRLLLDAKAGANAVATRDRNSTPLHYAAANWHRLNMTETCAVLLAAKADTEALDARGDPPHLHRVRLK